MPTVWVFIDFFFVSNNPWKYCIISLLCFLIKWNIWEQKCYQYYSYLNKKDMIFFQWTTQFHLYFVSLPNIINLFDIFPYQIYIFIPLGPYNVFESSK